MHPTKRQGFLSLLLGFLIVFLVFLLSESPSAAADPTMEQVSLLPENYLGMTLTFTEAWFNPDLYREDMFGDVIFGVSVKSKNNSFYGQVFSSKDLTFYVDSALASIIVAANLSADSYYSCNITCTIEKKTYYSLTYWVCKISKIETRTVGGDILHIYTDPSPQYTLEKTVYPPGGGTITLNPAKDLYAPGETVTCTASPSPGYVFSYWWDESMVINPINIMTQAYNGQLVAHFVLDPATNDTDNDGVVDILDQCPNTTVGMATDSVGCAAATIDINHDGKIGIEEIIYGLQVISGNRAN